MKKLQIPLEDELMAQIKTVAHQNNITLKELVTLAIQNYITTNTTTTTTSSTSITEERIREIVREEITANTTTTSSTSNTSNTDTNTNKSSTSNTSNTTNTGTTTNTTTTSNTSTTKLPTQKTFAELYGLNRRIEFDDMDIIIDESPQFQPEPAHKIIEPFIDPNIGVSDDPYELVRQAKEEAEKQKQNKKPIEHDPYADF